MGKYNLGEVWWTEFPFEEIDVSKRRPAIVIDENIIAILAMMVTSKDKKNPYSIKIDDWKEAGLTKESWAIFLKWMLLHLMLPTQHIANIHKVITCISSINIHCIVWC